MGGADGAAWTVGGLVSKDEMDVGEMEVLEWMPDGPGGEFDPSQDYPCWPIGAIGGTAGDAGVSSEMETTHEGRLILSHDHHQSVGSYPVHGNPAARVLPMQHEGVYPSVNIAGSDGAPLKMLGLGEETMGALEGTDSVMQLWLGGGDGRHDGGGNFMC
eukprot:TRINITY_DN15800_c0_g1_i1.p1 TRINITY_DN15800_c0_g1~~TRINITY_DN15800_c0_g1_i1.p1  ORF type:complete len:159 (-),score=11.36 TRINITY_DN15800_c0_g1_i1:377-853(-)